MSQYSETAGSFIRTGNYPLEAELIFDSEESLLEWAASNSAILHEGLLKVVIKDDGNLYLYWCVKDGDSLTFKKFNEACKLEEDVEAMNVTVGNIQSGDILPEGMTFTEFVIKMLVSPEIPTYSISSVSGLSTPVEVGTLVTGAIGTYTLNQGGSITNATATITAGFTDASTITVTYSSTTVTITFTARIALGNNTISSTIQYAESSTFPDEVPAGTLTATRTIVGRRRYFYGNGTAPTTSSSIRSGSSVLATSSFTYDLEAESTSMWLAIPSTSDLVSVTDAGALNADITSNFINSNTVSVDGATEGYDSIDYTIYQLSGYGPFSSAHEFTFTVE